MLDLMNASLSALIRSLERQTTWRSISLSRSAIKLSSQRPQRNRQQIQRRSQKKDQPYLSKDKRKRVIRRKKRRKQPARHPLSQWQEKDPRLDPPPECLMPPHLQKPPSLPAPHPTANLFPHA